MQAGKGHLRFKGITFFALALFLLSSCLPGTRQARKYIRQKDKESIFLLSPDFLYLQNLNSSAIQGYKQMDSLERDSALYFNSCYIQFLDDSILRRSFYNGMSEALRDQGYKVYNDSRMSEFFGQKDAVLISVAQQEMQEYSYPYYPAGYYEDTVVYASAIDVNGFALNSWFEVSRGNDSVPFQVLFNASIYEDTIDGDFYWNPFTDEFPYFYTRSDIHPDAIYALFEDAGRNNAGLMLDYLVNLYVNSHRKKKLGKDYYLHYDTNKRRFRLAKQYRLLNL